MSKILTVRKSGPGSFGRTAGCISRKGSDKGLRVLCMNKRIAKREEAHSSSRKGNIRIGLAGTVTFLVTVVIFSGAFYLYQVNDLATKGYEIKDLENRIAELEKANEDGKIKEVELKSMYNIEKSTENLNLVSSSDITYLETNGPVAMK